LLRLQEQLLAQDKNAQTWYALSTSGLVLYRAGRYAEAVRQLDQACKVHGQGGNAYPWLCLALAHQRLGHAAEARRWLEKSAQWIKKATREKLKDSFPPTPLQWDDRLSLELLRREAEVLIGGAQEKKNDSKTQPEGGQETGKKG